MPFIFSQDHAVFVVSPTPNSAMQSTISKKLVWIRFAQLARVRFSSNPVTVFVKEDPDKFPWPTEYRSRYNQPTNKSIANKSIAIKRALIDEHLIPEDMFPGILKGLETQKH